MTEEIKGPLDAANFLARRKAELDGELTEQLGEVDESTFKAAMAHAYSEIVQATAQRDLYREQALMFGRVLAVLVEDAGEDGLEVEMGRYEQVEDVLFDYAGDKETGKLTITISAPPPPSPEVQAEQTT